eukprot:1507885-Rhodomonas_salina.5
MHAKCGADLAAAASLPVRGFRCCFDSLLPPPTRAFSAIHPATPLTPAPYHTPASGLLTSGSGNFQR